MKPSLVLVIVLAAVAGGVIGGLVVALFSESGEQKPVAVPELADIQSYDDRALKAEIRRNAADLESARIRFNDLAGQLESARDERDALRRENSVLTGKVERLESVRPAALKLADTKDVTEYDRAAQKALERARNKEEAEAVARKEKQMARWMEQGRTRVLETLDKKLSLSQAQRDGISVVLDNLNRRIRELNTAGAAAKESGEDYDWQGEWNSALEDAETELRNELSSAQQTTYDELVGEGNISRIAWPDK